MQHEHTILQLLDASDTGLLTLRDLACFLGIIFKGDTADKLRLFYRLHLPPALLATDLESPISTSGNFLLSTYCVSESLEEVAFCDLEGMVCCFVSLGRFHIAYFS